MIKNIQNRDVFHGSYCIVKAPSADMGKNGKDFGKGFYATMDRRQAVSFAKLKAKREKHLIGFVSIYRLSDLQNLNVYEFENADGNWLNCIVGFRNKRYAYLAAPYRNHDVLIGKIADDDTSIVINAYIIGAYGEIGTGNAVKTAISLLKPERLKNQICFKNHRAIERLSFIRYEEHPL